jgi:hypothetical protein
MINLREVEFILGLQVTKDRNWRNIMMGEFGYVKKLLSKFGMATCKSIATPLDASAKLSKGQNPSSMEEEHEMANVPYKVAISSLMYCMVGSRLDLARTIGVVQFFNNLGLPNWQVVKQYLDTCKVFKILHYNILQIPSRKIMVYNCMVFVIWTREGMLILRNQQ